MQRRQRQHIQHDGVYPPRPRDSCTCQPATAGLAQRAQRNRPRRKQPASSRTGDRQLHVPVSRQRADRPVRRSDGSATVQGHYQGQGAQSGAGVHAGAGGRRGRGLVRGVGQGEG